MWGFVLSLAALVILNFSGGLLFIPALPLAIAGLVASKDARGKVQRGETRRGRAWADAGFVVGIWATAICAIAIGLAVISVLVG